MQNRENEADNKAILPIQSLTVNALTTAHDYIHAATSNNTRRAYQSDIAAYEKQGGKLPATSDTIVEYLQACATQLNPRTLKRRLTSLRQWHRLRGLVDPTDNARVKKTMQGIARIHGQPKQQAAILRLRDIDNLVAHLNSETTPVNIRNRALVLLGFFGALRRSELVGLQWDNIEWASDGMVITIPRSKTDTAGEGQQCIIPFGNEARCPVRALITWRKCMGKTDGFVFRRLTKSGQIGESAISGFQASCIIKTLARAINLANPDNYSGHSLRRGFATEAARLGAPLAAIQRHGRWRTTKTVIEYIETGRQFEDSAVNVLFSFNE